MKLDLPTIKEITVGAVKVFEENGEFIFRRFTDEETRYYGVYRDKHFEEQTLATAGIRIAFETDSRKLSFDYRLISLPWRPYGYFDITVNGVIVLHEGIQSGDGKGHIDISLDTGTKNIELWFSWSKCMTISNVTVDDAAILVPKKRSYTMINYGDSITHGYDSIYPSLSYASQLALILDADASNKAVGGDRFFPEILELDNGIDSPDIITVAYGTNDWVSHTRPTLERRSREFFTALSNKYPTAKIFAVTPIWRAKNEQVVKFGEPCTAVEALMREVCHALPNVTVINGWNLTPHTLDFYVDGLHPNDLGMSLYAKNLAGEIKNHL